MYIFIAKSKVDLQDMETFEQDQKRRSGQLVSSKGFMQRLILKSYSEPGIYFYISAWESKEDHANFKLEPSVKSWEGELETNGAHFVELERADCSIIVEDRASG